MIRAAGILFLDQTGHVLLCKRADNGTWAFPGGHIDGAETPEQAAVRECQEEIGGCPEGGRAAFARTMVQGVDLTTFIQRVQQFTPVLNDENTEFAWVDPHQLPDPMLWPAKVVIEKLTGTELQVAQRMRDGLFTSPQKFMNVWLFDIRIAGTDMAYRVDLKEHVYRDPKDYLTQEFIARCNGLPVIWEHPETATMQGDDFTNKVVGTIFLPYVKGSEVWGIAKIYDPGAAQLMATEQLSTSPAVVFKGSANNPRQDRADGTVLSVEGRPNLLDHLAICEQGVWDKGGTPAGVNSVSTQGEPQMTEDENKAAVAGIKDAQFDKGPDNITQQTTQPDAEGGIEDTTEGTTLDKILACVDGLHKRMDALEGGAGGGAGGEGEAAPQGGPGDDGSDPNAMTTEPMQTAADAAKDNEIANLRADAVKMRARMDSIQAQLPKSEAEMGLYADAQAKADSVYQAFGKHAPRPLSGESLLGYKRRLAKNFQPHSQVYKDVDLTKIADSTLMRVAEDQIFSDAMVAAKHPTDLPNGVLREIPKADATGRVFKTFVGSPSAWTADFRSPTRKAKLKSAAEINRAH
jgi:8-oxo-dGTP pyrophosphatase MutT (NUDIX family)